MLRWNINIKNRHRNQKLPIKIKRNINPTLSASRGRFIKEQIISVKKKQLVIDVKVQLDDRDIEAKSINWVGFKLNPIFKSAYLANAGAIKAKRHLILRAIQKSVIDLQLEVINLQSLAKGLAIKEQLAKQIKLHTKHESATVIKRE